ncbi:MAG TPA: hypothetical protein VEY06_04715, partial [Flavisolibacter sp.]|nr:hypothetical protein [Flavisolibacter sp.]
IKNLENIASGSIGASLGMTFNNYLGPALDFGIKGTTSIKIAGKAVSEKSGPSIGAGLAANISSRNGLTLSPNVSLTATSFADIKGFNVGLGLNTSYNSKSGIKQLQLSEQMSYNYSVEKSYHANKMESMGATLASTSISFTKPSYIPSLRMPLTNTASSGHFQIGTGLFGVYGSIETEVFFQTSKVEPEDKKQIKPLIGYLHYEKAIANPNAVMDFTRLNDNEVTPHTPIISAPQYTYDVFSIQGEGTGGSIRAYRNDMGYVRDNITRSKDKSLSIGADVGPPGHFGANFNTIRTPTVIGEWQNGNKLRNVGALGFQSAQGTQEAVYFRNPGETSVLHKDQFAKIGGLDLVRYKLGGSNKFPTLEPVLEQFSRSNSYATNTDILAAPEPTERKKRTQVTSFLTAKEASEIGLDKDIKNYNASVPLNVENNNLQFENIARVGGDFRKGHHISQINVTEANGRRYVYGIPVYNVVQKDFSFSVKQQGSADDKVPVDQSELTVLNTGTGTDIRDAFLQTTITPPYAHSFLLSGLLSADYVDVSGDGITEDDLGTSVKFNYTKMPDHHWQTPHTLQTIALANFNDGNRSERKDDKGLITYGKRESWYVHSIESKSMIALFTTEDRKDGKGIDPALHIPDGNDNSQKRLKKIDLYSKADLKKNGLLHAKPIKTVWFTYSYALCKNVPGNNGSAEMDNGVNVNGDKGKLTLDGIYFTFNGKNRVNKNKYVFG